MDPCHKEYLEENIHSLGEQRNQTIGEKKPSPSKNGLIILRGDPWRHPLQNN